MSVLRDSAHDVSSVWSRADSLFEQPTTTSTTNHDLRKARLQAVGGTRHQTGGHNGQMTERVARSGWKRIDHITAANLRQSLPYGYTELSRSVEETEHLTRG